jgi:hypothetical protein
MSRVLSISQAYILVLAKELLFINSLDLLHESLLHKGEAAAITKADSNALRTLAINAFRGCIDGSVYRCAYEIVDERSYIVHRFVLS